MMWKIQVIHALTVPPKWPFYALTVPLLRINGTATLNPILYIPVLKILY